METPPRFPDTAYAPKQLQRGAKHPRHWLLVLAGFFWPGLVLISTNAGESWRTLTD